MSFKNKFIAQLNKKKSQSNPVSFGVVDYEIENIPLIIEKRNDPWVTYGEDNLYPLKVNDLRNGSPIHNSIVKTKAKMTSGNGFLINGALNEAESKAKYDALAPNVKSEYDLFLKNPFDPNDTNKISEMIADDMQEQGQFCTEVIFNTDFNKITRIKYVNVQNIRAGKMEGDKVKTYWYSRNWAKCRHTEFKPVEISAFDPNNKSSLNQLYFEKIGKGDYYGELPYKGCLTWVMTDFKMGIFHLSNLSNGMNPGIWFKFYKVPESDDAKQDILNDLKKKYQGAINTNKMMVTFSNGKDLAPDVLPIQSNNLDKQLLLLAELCDKKIVTGHQLTSPLLAGVSVSGQLGGNTELKTAFQIFDNLSMEADRKVLERYFQRILDFNKTPIQLSINPFDPFKIRQTGTQTTQPTV